MRTLKRLRSLFRRKELDSALDEELTFHVEQKISDLVAGGMNPAQARTAALRTFGGVAKLREECQDMRGTSLIENCWQDLRYGVRTLFKDRRFSLLAIFALALGIGASTVVFSVIYDGLLNPFPYKDAGGITIFQIHNADDGGVRGRGAFPFSEFLDYRDQNHVFTDMVGTAHTNVLYSTASGTERLHGSYLTTNTFPFLGVPPLLGRWLTDEDGKPGAPPVFVMSYQMWKEKFAADPKLLGTSLILNSTSRTLVGVMPPRFRYFGSAVYFPFSTARDNPNAVDEFNRPRWLVAEERLKPGTTYQAVAADIDVIARGLAKTYPDKYPKRFTIHVDSLASDVVGDSKSMLYVLLAAVGMLLLIACSNVANLLLARATVREREIAVRASLGASRGRLVRQLLVESLVLAIAGGALGCIFAYAGIQVTAAIIPSMLPGEAVVELNRVVLVFAVGVTLLTTLICGLAPALHSVGGDLNLRLAGTAKGANSNFRHGKLRAGLVIVEVALSIVLLAGAGLMMRTLYALTHLDLGFNPMNVLAMNVEFPNGTYSTVPEKKSFFEQSLSRIQSLPGVVSAAETITLPPYNSARSDITVPGKTHAEAWNTDFDVCSEGYFQTLGLHLLRGKLLSASDVDSGRFVAVVNQTFARLYLAGKDPLGQKFKIDAMDQIPQTPHDAYFEVIGVVGDIHNDGLENAPLPQAYIPYTITAYENRALLIRTAVDPLLLVKNIQEQVWAVDHNVALTDAQTLTHYLQDYTYSQPEFGLESLGAFAGIGLLLAAIGIFSVMAYTVSLQTHEIGIRLALGAQRGDILKMVLRKGMALVTAGILIGLAMSPAVTRMLASQLWGVSANDPLTFGAVVVLVVAVGAAACFLPARRATRVDPLIALRYE
jgi:putative ABC transport system permease protein